MWRRRRRRQLQIQTLMSLSRCNGSFGNSGNESIQNPFMFLVLGTNWSTLWRWSRALVLHIKTLLTSSWKGLESEYFTQLSPTPTIYFLCSIYYKKFCELWLQKVQYKTDVLYNMHICNFYYKILTYEWYLNFDICTPKKAITFPKTIKHHRTSHVARPFAPAHNPAKCQANSSFLTANDNGNAQRE